MDIKGKLSGEYLEIYKELIMPVDTDISINRVMLSDENKKKITEFLGEYSFRNKFVEHGLRPMNRLLFYGASGTGKTFLSKALSNQLGFTMLYVDIAKSLTDGNVSKNISNIFKLANHLGECIIMFDECDSIAWSRDVGNSEGGDVRRATNSIFQHLDQMNVNNIFISATNMLHRLDPAFERRFNMKLEFRREINLKYSIKNFLTKFKEFKLEDNVNDTVMDIVERRTTLSYSEIEGIVERAVKRAIMNDTYIIRSSDIYDDFAIAMKIKLNFKTDNDPEEIFQSSIK